MKLYNGSEIIQMVQDGKIKNNIKIAKIILNDKKEIEDKIIYTIDEFNKLTVDELLNNKFTTYRRYVLKTWVGEENKWIKIVEFERLSDEEYDAIIGLPYPTQILLSFLNKTDEKTRKIIKDML